MSGEATQAQLKLGLRFLQLGRFTDAEHRFKEALASEPNSDALLGLLAHAVHSQDGREKDALEIIGRAIAVEPNDGGHHTMRAFILNSIERPRDGLAAAKLAQSLEPHSEQALAAQSQSYILLKDWPDAERTARAALAIDPEYSMAANLLAEALRNQGRDVENRAQIAGMLERDPENAYTHHSAGWAALQRGDHRAAETHFREALRLSPEMEGARQGLLASFRSRSPFYSGYLRYCLWMARLKEKSQWAVIIGVYLGFRFIRTIAAKYSPNLAIAIGALYLLLVLWAFVANAVGNFILLFDRFARHALKRNEAIEAAVSGGSVVAGLTILGAGFAFGAQWALLLGGALALGAIPWSMVFTNASRGGALLFGAVGTTLWVGAIAVLVGDAINSESLGDLGMQAFVVGVVGVLVSTWLSGIRALRRHA